MFIKVFEQFLQKCEDLLATDNITTRLTIRYMQRKKLVVFSLRSDKAVFSHAVREKADAKKIETILHKVCESLSNRKLVEEKMMAEAKANEGKGGKKKGKGKH